jgi:KUP system potassium uptake protein
VLSTLATIIASQALISGVFSLTHQAVQLGLFPRVDIEHTSAESEGQIYVPQINWGLAIACCVLVLVFEESSKLAAAYGIAVSGTMAITSVAFYLVVRRTWKWPAAVAIPLLVVFLGFDIPLFGANLTKFLEGGYVPILVGFVFFVVMISWRTGRTALSDYAQEHSMPIEEFLKTVDERLITRVPGTAVFLTSRDVPLILEHFMRRVRVLHEHVVLLTVAFDHVPYVSADERIEVTDLTKGFSRVRLRYGYIDKVDVPHGLAEASKRCASPFPIDDPTYYIGRETFLATSKGRLGPVRESIFAFLSRNAASAASYLGIPSENVMEIGAQIDL